MLKPEEYVRFVKALDALQTAAGPRPTAQDVLAGRFIASYTGLVTSKMGKLVSKNGCCGPSRHLVYGPRISYLVQPSGALQIPL